MKFYRLKLNKYNDDYKDRGNNYCNFFYSIIKEELQQYIIKYINDRIEGMEYNYDFNDIPKSYYEEHKDDFEIKIYPDVYEDKSKEFILYFLKSNASQKIIDEIYHKLYCSYEISTIEIRDNKFYINNSLQTFDL